MEAALTQFQEIHKKLCYAEAACSEKIKSQRIISNLR